MKLIHLTDTHLVTRGELLYGLDPAERLQQCVESIRSHHADAEMVVITGDLTHFGDRAAYACLQEILSQLPMPLHLVLGNHDLARSFARVFGERPAECRQWFTDTDVGRFLFLDTITPGSHAGHYDEQRLAWLTANLAACEERKAFLFMHHPPFAVGLPAMDKIGLQQTEQFKAAIRPFFSKIRHIFFGHVHRPIAGSWCAIPFTTLRATNHQVWLDFNEGTDVPGSHEPPAYCVVLIDKESVLVHYHDFLYQGSLYPLSDVTYDFWVEQQRRQNSRDA